MKTIAALIVIASFFAAVYIRLATMNKPCDFFKKENVITALVPSKCTVK